LSSQQDHCRRYCYARTLTTERRWSVEHESRLETTATDASARYGQRRRYHSATKMRVTVEVDGLDWQATYTIIAAAGGRPTISRVEIAPTTAHCDPPSLPSEKLRLLILPTGALEEFRKASPKLDTHLRLSGIKHTRRRASPRRRQQLSPYLLAVVSHLYSEWCQRCSPRPNVEVAQELREMTGEPRFTARYVTDLLHKARARELLERPAKRSGAPSGGLTDLGREILANGPPSGYKGPELPL